MSRISDIDWKLDWHLSYCATNKFHMKPNVKASPAYIASINRDLPFKYRPANPPTCLKVIHELYLLWRSLGCAEYRPDPAWAWVIYFDLKDVRVKNFAESSKTRKRGKRRG